MKVNPHIFRAYDLRGVAGKDLDVNIAEHIGKAFGTYLKRNSIADAVVGRDSRKTSEEYSKAFVKGIASTGVVVTDIGMEMVGTFYWAQHYLKIKGGAFITASHNPPEYNGYKFAKDYSDTLVTEGMTELRRLVDSEDYEIAKLPAEVKRQSIRDAYFKDILSRSPVKKKFKVVVDPSGTTAGEIVPELLRQAGCEVVEKHCKIEPNFYKGVADPTESMIAERLRDEVIESGADIGFSYDSDGDRIGIVDEKGGIIWNDVLVALFALDVLEDHPGATIMFNTLCSKAVQETILNAGGKPFMWRTGHSFLKKKNREVNAAFIGELSGHFFFSKDFYNHDDGAFSTLRLLRYLARTNQTLSQAVKKIPYYRSSPEVKIYAADEVKAALMKKIAPILKREFPKAEIIDDERAGDGVRLELSDAMFVVRYSQNGPYITIKFEAKNDGRYDELKTYIRELLHRFKEIDWNNKINVNVDAL